MLSAVLAVLLLLPAARAAAPQAAVTLEQADGAWWFRAPDGQRFLSLGVNHVEPSYWQSPSNVVFVADTYGPDLFTPDGAIRDGSPAAAKWAQRVSTNLSAWGFNTLGFHNPLSRALQSAGTCFYVVQLDVPVPWGWNSSRAALLQAFRRRPLDPFGDAFLGALEANAADVVRRYADDPRVLGYAYTDGPPWTVDDDPGSAALSPAERTLHPWVLGLMSLPAAAKGKQAWIACLKARYADAAQAGAVYACSATDWPALGAKTEWSALADPAKAAADSRAFLDAITRQWYDARKQAIRRYDASHLILGDKLNMNRDSRHPDELRASLAAMKPFVDVINLQYYGVFEKQRETLDLLYREAQKPILNGDTTCRPMWKDGDADAYYRERGEEFAHSLTNLFALPYFVGWHHCGYVRGLRKPYLDAVRRGDRKAAAAHEASRTTYREGLITELEEPIRPVLEPLSRALRACEAAHRPAALLRVAVTDAATGAPVACTVSITDSEGRIVAEAEAFKGGFRCEGAFEKRLPAGRTRLRVTRGFETRAESLELALAPGASTNVAVALTRAVDLRARGWVGGDSHAHMIHGERTIPVDFAFVGLTARAEDLRYFSLAHAWQLDDPTPERLDAALAPHVSPDCALAWNLEAPKNYYKGDAGRCLGHCWTLGMRGRTADGADAIPQLLRASAFDYESAKPTFANFESHALIHAQGGAVFYTHPARWWTGAWGGQGGYPKQEKMRVSNMAVELPLDTLLGPTYDGVDVFTSGGEAEANDKAFRLWRLLVSRGYRVAATASSDACFDRPGGAVPGSARTYTYLGSEPFSFAAVARATAAGRTFATTGPLLLASVDGLPPGSAVAADGRPHTLAFDVWASGKDAQGLKRVELYRNGALLRAEDFAQPLAAWRTNLVVRESEPAWYCARATGGAQGGRAVSGALFLDPAPHRPPPPAACGARVRVVDAATGRPLDATVTEVHDSAWKPRDGARHALTGGGGAFGFSGTARLRAEAPGYAPLTLSPVYDCPALADAITRLEDKDLLDWQTFEHLRALLADIDLTFRLKRLQP